MGTACSPVVVELPDEIDLTCSAAAEATVLSALSHSRVVIADMTGTAFCDSAGMRMLVTCHDWAEASGRRLRVVIRPGGSVARSIAILGIGRLVPVYTSMQKATQD